MPSSIVRGRKVVCRVTGRHEADVIDDGAVFQRDGTIVDVGSFADVSARHQADEVLGSCDHVVVPGFVNAHHHVGLTPLQLGSLDQPLELWWITRIGARDVDPYLDTLYSAFEMVESGVTTVQHIHGMVAAEPEHCVEAARRVLKAYDDLGMRVSYSYEIREQNPLAYEADEAMLGHLPQALASALKIRTREQRMPLEDHFLVFEELHRQFDQHDRIRIQLAPANLHLCSDRALEMCGEYAARFDVPMHIHLVESALQKRYAKRRTGTTALTHLHSLGLLGPRMTIGHGVWLTLEDIELAARTGIHICHNCSSNLRLRSGIAPLNHFEESGVRVAIGIDEAGINDDRDMLQEMRMVLNMHREPGLDDNVPTAAQVLRMATEHGAETTPFGATIGTLEPGKAADMVVVKWDQIAGPYLDIQIPAVDAIVHRAKPAGVDTVLVGGIPILREGRIVRINKDEALENLAASLASPLTEAERERRELAKSLYRPFKKYWEGHTVGQTCDPFYSMNSRV